MSASDEQLIQEISTGSPAAFRVFYNRHRAAILAFINRRYTRSYERAEDITQDVFLRVWLSAATFRPDTDAKATTWLYQIAKNAAFTDHRDRSRRPISKISKSVDQPDDRGMPPTFESPDPWPDRHLAIRQTMESANKAIQAMPTPYQKVLVLREFYGLKYDEIGKMLAIHPGTVRSRLFRARQWAKSHTVSAL